MLQHIRTRLSQFFFNRPKNDEAILHQRLLEIQKIHQGQLKLAERLADIQSKTQDIFTRTRDVQDRIYDVLWQQKTQNAHRDIFFWQIYKHPSETLEDAKLRFFHSLPKATDYDRKNQLVLTKLLKKIHDICAENNLSYWLDFGTLLGAIRHSGFIPWDDDIDIGMVRADLERLLEILKNQNDILVQDYFINNDENGIIKPIQIKWNLNNNISIGCIDIFIYDFCKSNSDERWSRFTNKKDEFKELSRKKEKTYEYSRKVNDEISLFYETYYKDIINLLEISYGKSNFITFGFENFPYHEHYINNQTIHNEIIFPLDTLYFEGYKFNVPNKYMNYISPMYSNIFSLPSDILSHKHFDIKSQNNIDTLNYLYNLLIKQKEDKN